MGSIVWGGGGRPPQPRKYQFIDGACFQMAVSAACERIAPGRELQIDYNAVGAGCERIIYFDALPARKSSQSDAEYQAALEAKRSELNAIRRHDNFHVRDGVTRLREGAKGRIEQKGVDTWIAIEALQYAFAGNVDVAEIITSDLDLYPLFEALTRTNTRGRLLYVPGKTAEELIISADQSAPITTSMVLTWLSPQVRNEFQVSSSAPSRSEMQQVGSGRTPQGAVHIHRHQDGWVATFSHCANIHACKSRLLLFEYVRQVWSAEIDDVVGS